MMASILDGESSPVGQHTARRLQTISELTPEAGAEIGAALSDCLMYNSTPAAAVDEWLTMFPALSVLEKECAWFKPMMKVVAKKKFAQSFFGLLLRAGALSMLSVVDMCSDAYSINSMYDSGEPGQVRLAKICAGLVALSFLLAVVVVLVQNCRQSYRKILLEILFVVLQIKPGIDSYRVMAEVEPPPLCLMNFENELIFTRIIEMIVESIPTSLFQLYAFLEGGGLINGGGHALLFSVILATLNTSYTSSCISFDKDTNPHNRARNPTFYSYVPNSRSGRNVIFVAMFFTTFCSIVIKTFGIVLFVLAGQLYFKLYILADLAFFFAYKAIRNDLRYWLNLPNVASLVLSFLIRACTKYLVDFTAVSPTKPRTPHSPFLTTNC